MADFQRDGEPIFVTADRITKCPRCTLPIFPDDKFCVHCNLELKRPDDVSFVNPCVNSPVNSHIKITGGARESDAIDDHADDRGSASAPPRDCKKQEGL